MCDFDGALLSPFLACHWRLWCTHQETRCVSLSSFTCHCSLSVLTRFFPPAFTKMPYNRMNSPHRKTCLYLCRRLECISLFCLELCHWSKNVVPGTIFYFSLKATFLTHLGYRVGQMNYILYIFIYCVCSLVYHLKMVVLLKVLLHLCTRDQHMVCIATKTFTVYMCITYILCIYVMGTRPGLYFLFRTVSLLQVFFIVLCSFHPPPNLSGT